MKIGKLFASLTTLISTVALAACAMSPYEGKYSHEDGWRKARIQETGSLEQLADKYGYTCPQADKAEKSATAAVVGYQGGGRWRKQLMLLTDKVEFKPDDLVYANIKQCGESLVSRSPE
ncbi:MAG: hypothetical protein IPN40_16600 [Uliginosibacterium sp.]|nr:hypothetical protein [Uliginosibacterium sp.]